MLFNLLRQRMKTIFWIYCAARKIDALIPMSRKKIPTCRTLSLTLTFSRASKKALDQLMIATVM